ncbi:MAG: DUF202 domain-containing protein [Actinomycetota bacterium]|nr:MAG: DUF202 domain-containing protein [Actinomycetota bacterium]
MPDGGPRSGLDYRYTLANERTFLAWIRTALALLAGGIALDQFATGLRPEGVSTVLGVAAIVLGIAVAVIGYLQWVRVQRAMRLGLPLPGQPGVGLLVVGVVVVAAVAVVGILLHANV